MGIPIDQLLSMNSQAKEFDIPNHTALGARSIAYCGLFWLILVFLELLPNLYVDWVNGDAPALNQLVRSASIYFYWFGMSLVVGCGLIRFPLLHSGHWLPHVGLSVALALGYVCWSAVSVKIFSIAEYSEVPMPALFMDHFLRFFLGELVVYAIIAGAWILAWRLQPLPQAVDSGVSQSKQITIRHGGSLRKISVSEIVRLESLENYVVVHTLGEKLMHRSTLKSMLEKLGEDFIQVHRSAVVNKEYIKRLSYTDNTLELNNGESVVVGRRRLASVSYHIRTAGAAP